MITDSKMLRLGGRVCAAGLLVAALLVGSISGAGASVNTLWSLSTTNGSLIIGDKLFSNFQYTSAGAGAFSADANAIFVSTIVDGADFGLKFDSPNTLYADSLTTAGSYANLNIEFDVTVLDANQAINKIKLGLTPGTIIAPGNASVSENVWDGSNLLASQANTITPSPLFDEIALGGTYQSLHIIKDIKLLGKANGYAKIDSFTQTFPQVPEPGSVIALAAGLVSFAGIIRKRG